MPQLCRNVLLLASALLAAIADHASAQTIDISLNVFPTSVAAPNSGGAWTLVAKTDHAFGISGIKFLLSGIDVDDLRYGPGVNAALLGGKPFVVPGNPIELDYVQDPFLPAVINVGTPSFSAAADSLGDPAWHQATTIAIGTYSGAMPQFATKNGSLTDGNLFGSATFPHLPAVKPTLFTTRRLALTGDYNRNGIVDAADYTLWRNTLDSSVAATIAADGDGNSQINQVDYQLWRRNFGAQRSGAGSAAVSDELAVPEPSGICALLVAAMAVPLSHVGRNRS